MNLTELMLSRRSCRKFTDAKVTESQIEALKQVALCAPTSKNCQSWEFIFVTDAALIEALSKSKSQGAAFLASAPLAVVVVGNTARTDVWVEDASIAATFIQLKAEELGLGSCWVQMRERGTDNIAELLGIPSGYEVECVIAVGHKLHERSPYEVDKLPTEHIHENKF